MALGVRTCALVQYWLHCDSAFNGPTKEWLDQEFSKDQFISYRLKDKNLCNLLAQGCSPIGL